MRTCIHTHMHRYWADKAQDKTHDTQVHHPDDICIGTNTITATMCPALPSPTEVLHTVDGRSMDARWTLDGHSMDTTMDTSKTQYICAFVVLKNCSWT